MYIQEVIRKVREIYPNEYSLRELYSWCDEVSAGLTQTDRPTYRECKLPVSADGTVVLPHGVKAEYIERVIADGRELNREDIRTLGKKTINIKGYNSYVENTSHTRPSSVTVIYQKPYSPIRLPIYKGRSEIDAENGIIYVDNNEFITNDILIVQTGDKTLSELPLIATSYSAEKDKIALEFGVALDIDTGVYETTTITRVVTEETVCDAPFDSMYVDYILAQIGRFQGDNTAYNGNMVLYNGKLQQYKTWLVQRMPNDNNTFKNWW